MAATKGKAAPTRAAKGSKKQQLSEEYVDEAEDDGVTVEPDLPASPSPVASPQEEDAFEQDAEDAIAEITDAQEDAAVDALSEAEDEAALERQQGGDDDSDALSDLDEEEYAERRPVDEDVYKLKTTKLAGRRDKSTEAPKGKRRAPRARKSDREVDDDEYDDAGTGAGAPRIPIDEDDATRERRLLEEKIDAALKPSGKRRRLAGEDLEQMQDEKIARIRDEMRIAALSDIESIRKGEPALHKIKMLPRVRNILRKHNLADSILDGNLLESVRVWLEPLPDASLPSYEIQLELFYALTQLPIKTIHLRESGLGRVVLFYQKSKRPHLHVKRMADRLIGEWTRPIMGRSDNYRDKVVHSASYDPAALVSASPQRRDARSSAEEAALRRNRAALPTARGDTYRVAPRNVIASEAALAGRQTGDSQLRRMKTKLLNASRQQKSRKSNVSIEGRNLH